jgi:hypothetical protein
MEYWSTALSGLVLCSFVASLQANSGEVLLTGLGIFFLKLITFVCSALQFLIAANIVPSSLILFTLTMEAIYSSEISGLSRPARHHIPQDGILFRLI